MAWWGGVRTAAPGAILGWLCANYFLSTTPGSLLPGSEPDMVAGAVFLVSCSLIVALGEHRKRDAVRARRGDRSRAQLASIVESSDDAIISKTLEGRITSWNAAAERLLGYSAAEMIGRQITEIIPSDRMPEEQEIMSRLRRGERIEHFQTVRQGKYGQRLHLSLTVSPMRDGEGRIIGASKIARDIGARFAADREREDLLSREKAARAEAERANRMKDEFIAVLSHELRTPLNAILGWTTLLRRDASPDGTLSHGLAVIERNSRVQSELITDLLDMSRITSGTMRLEIRKFALGAVIDAALESIRPAAESKGISIRQTLECIPAAFVGDPARLEQVIWNLLANAVKFTPRGGHVHVHSRPEDSHVVISISDTGKGISPAFLPHVFERFRQADSSAARQHGGLGIGLAIVKHLVELHGGTVQAESAGEGAGSTFTVRLPLHAEASEHAWPDLHNQHGSSERARVDLAGVTVLVVEDESDARDLVRTVLEAQMATVLTAESVDEALAAATGNPIDVILSDIGLPGRDGYTLLHALRANGITAPAAAVTAFARSEDRIRTLNAGYQMHIAKPFDTAQLVEAVAALVRSAALKRAGKP
jgi:PAS domain S-box-containing protein